MKSLRLSDNFRYTDRSAMRDQIDIYQPNPGRTADGSPGPLVLFASGVWAYIRARNDLQVNAVGEVQAEMFWDVRTPYMDGVNSEMTVIGPTGETWFIVGVSDPDFRRVELRFLCREVNDGVQTQASSELPTLVTVDQPIPDIDGGDF